MSKKINRNKVFNNEQLAELLNDSAIYSKRFATDRTKKRVLIKTESMRSALLQLSVSDAVSSSCNMENLKNQFTKNLNRSSIKALQLMFYEKTLHHFFDKRKIVLHT